MKMWKNVYDSFVNIRNYDRIAQYYENVVDSDEE
jgi:hypothetical protein